MEYELEKREEAERNEQATISLVLCEKPSVFAILSVFKEISTADFLAYSLANLFYLWQNSIFLTRNQ